MQVAHQSAGDIFLEGTVYYSPHAVVVLANSFNVEAGDRTLERKSMRLIYSCSGPFSLELADGAEFLCHGILLGPKANLKSIKSAQADIVLIDFPITSSRYRDLERLLNDQDSMIVPQTAGNHLPDAAIRGQLQTLSFAEIETLIQQAVDNTLYNQTSPTTIERHGRQTQAGLDSRILKAIDKIKISSLHDIRLTDYAQDACLSADRFRHLFKEETGCTFSHYARSFAVWKALAIWEDKRNLTDACLQAGFYDLSHFYRAYFETFGVHWRENNNVRKLKRVRFYDSFSISE
ncbi:MAG: helix-turn-helix domain-containing protein [Pseudomonadales bacterium]|nr:helix-turn-helix domain-containing protein [Pseudomonadales bacterium]